MGLRGGLSYLLWTVLSLPLLISPCSHSLAAATTQNTSDKEQKIYNLLVKASKVSRAEAVDVYREVVGLDKCHAKAWHNMGTAYMGLKDFQRAREALDHAISCKPDYVLAYANLAATLVELHQVVLAKDVCTKGESLPGPLHWHLYSTCGSVCLALGDKPCATRLHEKATKMDPKQVELHRQLANTYEWQHQYLKAKNSYVTALNLQMDPGTWVKFVNNNRQLCVWSNYQHEMTQLRELVLQQLQAPDAMLSISPWPANYLPFGPTDVKAIAMRHAREWDSAASGRQDVPMWSLLEDKTAERQPKLNVGYIGIEFDGDGPIGHLIWRMFQHHHSNRTQIHIFALGGSNQTPSRKHIASSVYKVHDVSMMTYSDISNLIERLQIHVLVDIAGWLRPESYRVMSQRPSPVIISLPASPATSGTSFVDFFTADREIIPGHLAEPQFTEKMLYFPQPYHYMVTSYGDCDEAKVPRPDALAQLRRQHKLPTDKVIFACFSTLYKVDPFIFATWVRIMKQVPNSVLWMQRGPKDAVPSLQMEWKRAGLDKSRLIFCDRISHDLHLQRLPAVDLILDTTSFTAHGTGMDYYWAGIPMVTLRRAKLSTRLAAAITKSLNESELDPLITTSLAEYEQVAVSLAKNRDKLLAVREAVTRARCRAALFDTQGWIEQLERGFEHAWEMHTMSRKGHIIL